MARLSKDSKNLGVDAEVIGERSLGWRLAGKFAGALGDWAPVDGRRHALCGKVIKATCFNKEWDMDWNVLIKPSVGFEHLYDEVERLRPPDDREWNSESSEKYVEAEVSIHEQTNALPPPIKEGATACALGPWVLETVHNDKPEIHPADLFWWRSDEHLLIAATFDWSGRFDADRASRGKELAKAWTQRGVSSRIRAGVEFGVDRRELWLRASLFPLVEGDQPRVLAEADGFKVVSDRWDGIAGDSVSLAELCSAPDGQTRGELRFSVQTSDTPLRMWSLGPTPSFEHGELSGERPKRLTLRPLPESWTAGTEEVATFTMTVSGIPDGRSAFEVAAEDETGRKAIAQKLSCQGQPSNGRCNVKGWPIRFLLYGGEVTVAGAKVALRQRRALQRTVLLKPQDLLNPDNDYDAEVLLRYGKKGPLPAWADFASRWIATTGPGCHVSRLAPGYGWVGEFRGASGTVFRLTRPNDGSPRGVLFETVCSGLSTSKRSAWGSLPYYRDESLPPETERIEARMMEIVGEATDCVSSSKILEASRTEGTDRFSRRARLFRFETARSFLRPLRRYRERLRALGRSACAFSPGSAPPEASTRPSASVSKGAVSFSPRSGPVTAASPTPRAAAARGVARAGRPRDSRVHP
jgi:hypothetical protein